MTQNIIAIIFDFDITLSPQFQQKVIFDDWGITGQEFWQESNENMKKGFDMEHAYLKTFIDYGRNDDRYALTNGKLYEYGKSVELYEGLSKKDGSHSIFDDLQSILEREEFEDQTIKLEFYCISGGIKELIQGSFDTHRLSNDFKEIFACTMAEDDTGKLGYVKETVGHTIKTQKLFMIAKGVSPENGDDPSDVNEVTKEYRIPFENMVFLGDGQTDIPAFSLLNRNGGTSIAVYREEKNPDGTINESKTLQTYQNGYKLAIESNRAEQLLPADYSSGKPLKMALLGYVEKIARNIASKR